MKGLLFSIALESKKMKKPIHWMVGGMRKEKGRYKIYNWVVYGAESLGLGTLGQSLLFHEALVAVARVLQNPFGRVFRAKKMKGLVLILDAFLALLDKKDLLIAEKFMVQGRLGTYTCPE